MKNICLLLLVCCLATQAQSRKFKTPIWTTHSKNTDIAGVSIGTFPKSIFTDSTLTRTFGVRLEIPGPGILLPLMPKSPLSTSLTEFENKLGSEPSEIVYGINLSSGSTAETQVNGISGAFIGQYFIKMNGVAIAGIGNIIEKQNGMALSILGNDSYVMNGLSGGFIGNHTQTLNGAQIGGFNVSEFTNGIQIGIQNNNNKNQNLTNGAQIGVLNYTEDLQGVQIGLINNTKSLKGIQIGLWNKNEKRSLPIINWNF